MAYKPQYYPGATSVAANRRKHMSGDVEKLREISDDDLVMILGTPPTRQRLPQHPPHHLQRWVNQSARSDRQ